MDDSQKLVEKTGFVTIFCGDFIQRIIHSMDSFIVRM